MALALTALLTTTYSLFTVLVHICTNVTRNWLHPRFVTTFSTSAERFVYNLTHMVLFGHVETGTPTIQILKKVTSRIKTVLYRQSHGEFFRKRTTRCTELHAIARTCANLHILACQCTNLHEMARRCTNLLVTARHCTSLHTYRFLINRPGSLGQRPSRAFSATQRQVIWVPEYSGYSVLALALTVARHLQI
jgi:hypothetical protein